MADQVIKRDQNRITVLAGVTDDAAQEIRMLPVDPITGRLLISLVGGGGSVVESVTGTAPIVVNNTDPANPVVSLQMNSGRLLGRTTAGFGNAEEIQVGAGLQLAAGVLSSTGGGTGDVIGPASSTDNAVVRFDGTTGKLVQDSTVTVDDTGKIAAGNSVTPARLTSASGPRSLNLIDTNSVIRIWRFAAGDPAVEFVSGTNDNVADPANFWWDFFLDNDIVTPNERMVLRRRTGGVSSEKLSITPSLATFSVDVEVPDEAYGPSWDGSLEAPTKNALYDKIQTIGGGSPGGSNTQLQYNNSGAFGGAAVTYVPGTLSGALNYMEFGPTVYPVSAYPAASNAYFIIDKNGTASDASLVLRDQGAARAEIGLITDNHIRFKTVTGAYAAEVFTDRMIIRNDTGRVGVGNTSAPDANLHVFGNSGEVGLYVGEVGSGRRNLELAYNFTTDKSTIISIQRGAAYKTLEMDAANLEVWTGASTPVKNFEVTAAGQALAPVFLSPGTNADFGASTRIGAWQDTATTAELISYSNTPNTNPVLLLKRSRGTQAAKTTVAFDDDLGEINAAAYNGTAFITPGAIKFVVGDAVVGSSVPTAIIFETGTSNGRSERLRITHDGRVYGTALHNNAGAVTGPTNQYIASGTYTPTVTGVTNVAQHAAFQCQWMRVGNVVTVSGRVQMTPTAAGGAATQLAVSLPIASAFTVASHLGGTANSTFIAANDSAGIYADPTNDRAEMYWRADSISQRDMMFTFTYLIL